MIGVGPVVPDYWGRARRSLARRDPVLSAILRRHRGATLRSRGDAFQTLARSIVGQQISVRAADSVWARLTAVLPGQRPEEVLSAGRRRLQQAGLSERKAEYLLDLARHFAGGRFEVARWSGMNDEAVVAELTQIRGIGRWTAEMFLIFNLLRPDVLPADDLGLQRAVGVHYQGGGKVSRADVLAVGARWAPWRSVATWYLWRSLDPVPVEY